MSPSKLQSILKEALALHKSGRGVEAEKLYRQARIAAPRSFDAFQLSGALAYQQGRAEQAVEYFAHALKLDRKSIVCAMRLGMALFTVGRNQEAEKQLRWVVETRPDFYEGWDKLAHCLKLQDRLDEAVACHLKAVALKPEFAGGWYNLGLTYALMGKLVDALPCHEKALAVDPTYALALFGRAQVLHQLHRIPEAVDGYQSFLALCPENHEARSNHLFALHSMESISRESLFAEHVAYGRAVGHVARPALRNSPYPNRRLRVGIVSPDLRFHSCAFFLEPLLAHFNPNEFELYLYHDHFREDEVSARLRSRAAVWRNIVGKGSDTVEGIIRGDAPDILIDLAGHTGLGNRLPLYARRLAPVQVTYLGYPDTTGLPAMDYRFTDAVADPIGEADAFATEKLVRFGPTAWTYAPLASAPDVSTLPAAELGRITFGCFNNLTKFTDGMLRTWGRLLAMVPDSRLMLKGTGLSDPVVRARFHERIEQAGLPFERVVLLERTPTSESHLAAYGDVDIALDCFPYHGTTTTCESLWMGVPVVSLSGDRHMSRVGASLLRAIGHPEWVTQSEDEYVQVAAKLAADVSALRSIRSTLRDQMRRSPLMDHAGQSARFAAALRTCWQAWCSEQAAKAA